MTDFELVALGFAIGFFTKPYFDIILLIVENAWKNTKNLED